ncbi:17849_t:CDS:2, partial [Gigaspora rosea]
YQRLIMGKSAKFTKRLTKEAKRVQAIIKASSSSLSLPLDNNQTTTKSISKPSSKSSSNKEEILGPKPNSSTKITKKQNKKKKVRAAIAKFKRGETVNDDKERDYVDIFVGKSTYKPLNED